MHCEFVQCIVLLDFCYLGIFCSQFRNNQKIRIKKLKTVLIHTFGKKNTLKTIGNSDAWLLHNMHSRLKLT